MHLKQHIAILNSEYRTKLMVAIQNAPPREIQEVFFALGDVAPNGVAAAASAPEAKHPDRPEASKQAAGDLAKVVARAVRSMGSASISDIATALALPKESLVRPIRLAIASGAIKRVGEKWRAKYVPTQQ